MLVGKKFREEFAEVVADLSGLHFAADAVNICGAVEEFVEGFKHVCRVSKARDKLTVVAVHKQSGASGTYGLFEGKIRGALEFVNISFQVS